MTPEHLRRMRKDELLKVLESALEVSKHMSLVEDPRVHGTGEDGPLMAIGDLEIWPRGEPEAAKARLEVVCAESQKFLDELGEGKIMECCKCFSTDAMFQSTDIADRYEELRASLAPKEKGMIQQHRCETCGITHPSQMEVTGPFAWQANAARKYFCSVRCFRKWLVRYQDEREEADASAGTSQDPPV